MIARIEIQDLELRRELVQVLVPADPELWSRRVAVDEDLLTWWAVMGHIQKAIVARGTQWKSLPFAVRAFRHLGQVLADAGATSGAELVDGRALVQDRVRHGSFRYER